ncbi:epoxide hydrolase family protein [Arthrobacter yangruifuii]|uniref:epoxide hydrolase family protein n=1 Tax=Arthrobacter yangruifuii TaxID=2606616 RepID=UPI001AEE1B0A|nr:epoxide hydrolase N-terminal domain-containing protein [Arthrobacter yangruifuii]
MNEQIQPFSIPIDPALVDRLGHRLRGTRFAPALPGEEWATGVPAGYLERVVAYWADEYDWALQAAALNGLPQFTTVIDGQRIHFLHIRSKVEGALPLLLTHGWPGSFVEFLDLIGPLTDPAAHGRDTVDAFDLVIPSLPGFGFSTPVTEDTPRETSGKSQPPESARAAMTARISWCPCI